MTDKVLTAGDEVDSYCTTCKLILAHQVVAMIGTKPDKVICKTCGKTHKYRPNLPKARTTGESGTEPKPKKSAARTKKARDAANKWEELLARRSTAYAKKYTMQASFELDDVLEHEKFGFGFVTKVKAEGKMEVLFKDGVKLLVCERK